jgi:hypothetical protein
LRRCFDECAGGSPPAHFREHQIAASSAAAGRRSNTPTIPTRAVQDPPVREEIGAARLMAAARAADDPRERLAAGLLARTGMRAGLEADAVMQIGAGHRLRIPLGKLRNNRYVPPHPELVQRSPV